MKVRLRVGTCLLGGAGGGSCKSVLRAAGHVCSPPPLFLFSDVYFIRAPVYAYVSKLKMDSLICT